MTKPNDELKAFSPKGKDPEAEKDAYDIGYEHGRSSISDLAPTSQWRDISTIPPSGQFLAAWPEVELDEDGDLTDKKTGKYFIGAIDMACGQPNGEPDSLNAMGEWYGDDTCWSPDPTHWMPLPATPTKDLADSGKDKS